MVRRTRRHIREHWPNAQINGQKIIFPDRKLTTIRYNINKVYDGLYDHLRRLIEPPDPDIKKTDGLRYARYGLIRRCRSVNAIERPLSRSRTSGVASIGTDEVTAFQTA